MDIKEIFNNFKKQNEFDKLEKDVISNFKIINNQITHIEDALTITDNFVDSQGELKIPVSRANSIIVKTNNISSFKNFPEILFNNNPQYAYGLMFVRVKGSPSFTSLEGIPKIIKGSVSLVSNKFDSISYSGIHHLVKQVTGYFNINANYRGPLLGFLLIEDLNELNHNSYSGFSFQPEPSDCIKASVIISKHLKTEDRDILECQEELLNNGLKDFAKL